MDLKGLFVGAYDRAGAGGVYPLGRVEEDNWRIGPPDTLIRNPSYATFSLRHGLHYVLDECEQGRIGVLRHAAGAWSLVQAISSGGAGPCFVALNAAEDVLAVANYACGAVAAFDVLADGRLSGPSFVHRNAGGGPHPRQDGPHAHCVCFHDDRLYSTDLGTDEILMHAGKPVVTSTAFRFPAGQGPRHMVFHPALPLAYVLTELGNSLFTLRLQPDGPLFMVAHTSTLPDGFAAESIASHLALGADGASLFVANRGDDSLIAFTLQADGIPVWRRRISTGAAGPRHFLLLDQQRVVIAHQHGGRVTVLDLGRDAADGPVTWSAALAEAAFIGALPDV